MIRGARRKAKDTRWQGQRWGSERAIKSDLHIFIWQGGLSDSMDLLAIAPPLFVNEWKLPWKQVQSPPGCFVPKEQNLKAQQNELTFFRGQEKEHNYWEWCDHARSHMQFFTVLDPSWSLTHNSLLLWPIDVLADVILLCHHFRVLVYLYFLNKL